MLTRLLALLIAVPWPALGAVTLQAPGTPIVAQQPFELVITIDRAVKEGALQTAALPPQFQVLASRHQQFSQFSSGQSHTATRWTLTLSAARAGIYQLPPIPVAGEFSAGQLLQVLPAPPPPPPAPAWLEAELESTEVYAGVPVRLTLRVHYRIALGKGARLREPTTQHARLLRAGKIRYGHSSRDGYDYQVLEQDYLLIPERTGLLQIPPARFSAQIADAGGKQSPSDGQEAQLELDSPTLELEVLTPPSKDHPWLPAADLQLTESWENLNPTLRAGDTLTRTLRLTATQVGASQLPSVEFSDGEGWRTFARPPLHKESVSDGLLTSESEQSFQVLVTRPGALTLPPLRVRWWNIATERWEEASLPAKELTVTPFTATSAVSAPNPAPSSSAPPTPEPKPRESSIVSDVTSQWLGWFWALIALICALGWTQCLSRLRQQQASTRALEKQLAILNKPDTQPRFQPQEERQRYQSLARSCHQEDAAAVASNLIRWAQAFWPQQRISSLSDVRSTAQDPALDYLLRNLEHRLRHPDPEEPWTGDILISQLRKIRMRLAEESPP